MNKKTFFTEVEVSSRVGLQPFGIYVFMITESSCNLLRKKKLLKTACATGGYSLATEVAKIWPSQSIMNLMKPIYNERESTLAYLLIGTIKRFHG